VPEERLEAYLLGELAERDRAALEDHFFACEACQERLEILSALPAGLAERVGSGRQGVREKGAGREGAQEAGPHQEEPRKEGPGGGASAPPDLRARSALRNRRLWLGGGLAALAAGLLLLLILNPGNPADLRPDRERLARLARFDPPRYQPLVLRGTRMEDPAFALAMEPYRRGDYAAATRALAELAEGDPQDLAAQFFLGASALLAGETERGIRALQASITLGDSIYLEEARLLLAKARIGQGRLDEARQQLEEVEALRGDLAEQARRLLAEIDGHSPSASGTADPSP
jgi:hypothetical protein